VSDPVVAVSESVDGAYWTVTLDRPRPNIIDGEMTAQLTDVFVRAKAARALKAICLTHAGPDFSFGASVEEHREDQVRAMLHDFHGLFRAIADASVTVLAAVKGNCLGGGLELVTFCHRIFADRTVKMGQPEIRLGVFAPVASALLPARIGQTAAEDLCLTGRVVVAEEALKLGLVDDLTDDDPVATAFDYFEKGLSPHSAESLRHACRAVRTGMYQRFFAELEVVEHSYLEGLMATTDAREGIAAFLEKRTPTWRNA
jgi:cyclohexa-1,5-dienecarbonyl-CoA hydratase